MIKKRIFCIDEEVKFGGGEPKTNFVVEYRVWGILIYKAEIEYKYEHPQSRRFSLSELFQLL